MAENAQNPAPTPQAKKWSIVNVQTSCELKAKSAIEERIKSNKLEAMFGEILIPAENVVELVKGQKTTKSRKFFPGYIFVNMILNDVTWHMVKNSSKVTGFVGSSGGKTRPPEVPEACRHRHVLLPPLRSQRGRRPVDDAAADVREDPRPAVDARTLFTPPD